MGVRSAVQEDLPRLLEIYNHYVLKTHVTFDLEALSLEARQPWFDDFAEKGPHRLLVSETKHRVSGYACSRVFRAKAAYARSVETSIYLDTEFCARGVGFELYENLLSTLQAEEGVHRAYAGVALPNDASVALHERLGYKQVAVFSDVGFKFGRYWDVVWYERAL